MIKKNNLWFVTLFSLILILGVYYITMPNDILEKAKELKVSEKPVIKDVKEESSLVAMRVNLEAKREEEKTELQSKLTNDKLTSEEKNNVYEELKYNRHVKEYKLDNFNSGCTIVELKISKN